jgi:hypothetical protein
VYDRELVCAIVRNFIEVYGMPETFEALKAGVRELCDCNNDLPGLPRAPGNALLTELLKPLYRRPKKSSEIR